MRFGLAVSYAGRVGGKAISVETAVEVVDVDGNPLPGITVNLTYLTLVESKLPEW